MRSDRQIPSILSYIAGEEFQGAQAKAQLVRNPRNTVAYFRDFVGKESVMPWHLRHFIWSAADDMTNVGSNQSIQVPVMRPLTQKNMTLQLLSQSKIPNPKHPTISQFLKLLPDISNV